MIWLMRGPFPDICSLFVNQVCQVPRAADKQLYGFVAEGLHVSRVPGNVTAFVHFAAARQ